jgi:hypothetical protein
VEFGEQGGFGEWFLDEVDAGFEDALLAEQALGVAGHEYHPGGRLQDVDLVGGFFSLHVRHDHVGAPGWPTRRTAGKSASTRVLPLTSAAIGFAEQFCGGVPELEAYLEWLRQRVLGYTGRGASHDPGKYMQPVFPANARRIQFGDERFWALVTALADAVQAAGTLKWRRARQVLRGADPFVIHADAQLARLQQQEVREMGIYLRILPGVKVRLTRRGVRWGLGPRAARLHLGAGGPGVSTGAVLWYRPLRRRSR